MFTSMLSNVGGGGFTVIAHLPVVPVSPYSCNLTEVDIVSEFQFVREVDVEHFSVFKQSSYITRFCRKCDAENDWILKKLALCHRKSPVVGLWSNIAGKPEFGP
jgi:hypothetical protein